VAALQRKIVLLTLLHINPGNRRRGFANGAKQLLGDRVLHSAGEFTGLAPETAFQVNKDLLHRSFTSPFDKIVQ
jgi:hypothetical protein